MRAGDFKPIPASPPQAGKRKARHEAGLIANKDSRMQLVRGNGYQHRCRCTFVHSRKRSDFVCPLSYTRRKSGDLRVRHSIFGPARRVRLTKLHRITCHARKTSPPVIGNHGLHAFVTVRAAGRIHRPFSISNKTPHWNNGSAAALTIVF